MQRFYFRISLLWTFSLLTSTAAFPNYAPGNLSPDHLSRKTETWTIQPLLTNPSGCNLGLPINDFSCDPSHLFQINVAAAPGTVMGTDVFLREVRVIIYHEWDADLDMSLISPGGVEVELSTDNGSGNNHYGNPNNGLCNEFTAFISPSIPDACSAINIRDAEAPFIGSYLPEGNLNEFNDGTNPLGIWTLKICDDGKEHYGTLEYAELVFEATDCLPPGQVTVTAEDSTAVTLGWVPGTNCASTIVEYGPQGFLPGTGASPNEGTVVLAGCPPLTITGLAGSTTYDVYVREQCGPSAFSDNSCALPFATSCSPPPATIVEDFNTSELCTPICGVPCDIQGLWRNAPDDDFDWTVYQGPTGTSQTGPTDDVPGGGRYAYIETSGTSCRYGNQAVLTSNCVEIHANPDSCDFSFNYNMYGVHTGSISFEITLDGGIIWQPLWQLSGNQGNGWRKQYLDLDAFDGLTAQFRFVAAGGNGFRGDMAIDNLVFYGSLDLGEPAYKYYLDQDGDGYGQSGIFVSGCQPAVFPGYVANAGDCDDTSPFFNPGLEETPCDGIDVNCNGMDDEFFLPPPVAVNDTVCSGAAAQVEALPAFAGDIYWYDAEYGGNLLYQGNIFIPQDLPQNTADTALAVVYFAEEHTPNGCISTARQAATITIYPQPQLSTQDAPVGCAGDFFDLGTVDIFDANGTNGTLSFFNNLPLEPANETSPLVQPFETSTYYIVSTAAGGCRDSVQVVFSVKPSPVAAIAGDTLICRGGSETLFAQDAGNGVEPLTFDWNSGSASPQLSIFGSLASGQTDVYAVTIIGGNGCTSADSLFVTTVTSVDTVQVVTQEVSQCNGNDGAITLTPLDGVAPFTYQWPGGAAIEPGAFTLNNLTQAAYSMTITDSSPAACPLVLPVLVVNGPAAIVSLDFVDNVDCHGGTDGCISLEVIGNNPGILWSNGDTTATICGLAAGQYTVTVTEGACSNVLTIPVNEPEALAATPHIEDVDCFGGSNGSISLSVFGGTPFYQYNWSDGKIGSAIQDLPAGQYSVTISDGKGCQLALQNIFVKQPAPISLDTVMVQGATCNGFNDGEIGIEPVGGSPAYSIGWSNGGAGSTIANLAAGNYSVTVTDTKGCTFQENIEVAQPAPVLAQLVAAQNPVCNGIDNGWLDATASGGYGGYQYLWNTGAQTEDLTGLGPGAYVATVTDAVGCTAVSDTFALTGAEVMAVEVDKTDPACVGIENGSISVSVMSGGTAPFQYDWSTDESGPSLANLPEGTYSVTVTDGVGCLLDTTIVLTLTQPMTAVANPFPPACYGTPTGQLSLTPSGGVEPYDIHWSTGDHAASISGLMAGNYTATITDDLGCKLYLDLIPLNEPHLLEVNLESLEEITCSGGSDGFIDVTATGGTGPLGFNWTSGAGSEDLTGLAVGTYQLTITDANGCVTVSPEYSIDSPQPIVAAAAVTIPSGCELVQFDSVCLSVSGGVEPFQFAWSNGATTPCLTGVETGDYSVTLTDASGCTGEVMPVKVPDAVTPVVVAQSGGGVQNICDGVDNGELNVVIAGGAKPYQFIWSSGGFGITVEDSLQNANLEAGQYNVTITDDHGCTAVSEWMTVTMFEPLSPVIPGNEVSHVKCKQGHDGSLNLSVSGGLPPYQYLWTNALGETIGFTEDLNNLGAGTYSVIVTDSLGCTGATSVEIHEPEFLMSILFPVPKLKDVSCFGLTDGRIDISPSGGVPPYAFLWSNNDTTEDVQGLAPGIYTVTITDSNICALFSQQFEIAEPASVLSLSDYNVLEPTCFGISDGYIDVDLAGGTPPYFYSWDLPSANEDLFGIGAGTYNLTVLDTNSCTFDTQFVVQQPPELLLDTSAQPATDGLNNGVAIAAATGGVPPYTYSWNTAATGDTLANLAPGWYGVNVTDANFCQVSAWVEVGVLVEANEVEYFSKLIIYPNPASGNVTIDIGLATRADLQIKVLNSLGQEVFFFEKDNFEKGEIEMDLTGHAAGLYWITFAVNGRVVGAEKLLLLH
jgi:subtilisin-like proprotein convertase family protein